MTSNSPGIAVVLALLFSSTLTAVPAGETPPPGPPWKMDFMAARKEAMKEGRPIFMYFTKTV